ncbi:MAG: response regulator transcription factor [Clostridia bacterium]|nr:response regulator transcription factor [Clostridia bacterium]
MKFNIAICDDEISVAFSLKNQVEQFFIESEHTAEVFTFSSAEAFLFDYEENSAYDILLLDVEMKNMDGIQLAKKLRNDGFNGEIIFITSHFEFCGEGYEVDALHYLIKTVSKNKLNEVIEKAVEKLLIEPPSVIINCDGETVKLYERDIIYVEAYLHYVTIYTVNGEHRVKENISSFEKKLTDVFYKTHRSYLVSLKYITRISRNSVTVKNNKELPLARGKYDDINRAFIEIN